MVKDRANDEERTDDCGGKEARPLSAAEGIAGSIPGAMVRSAEHSVIKVCKFGRQRVIPESATERE